MFAVIGHTLGIEGTLPYAGPVAGSANAAIDAWAEMAIANGELSKAIQEATDALKTAPIDTLVNAYGGDEIVVVSQLFIKD